MTDALLPQDVLDASEDFSGASEDYQRMVADLEEYELNCLDFPTLVSIVRTHLRERYENYDYEQLLKAYNQIFGGY